MKKLILIFTLCVFQHQSFVLNSAEAEISTWFNPCTKILSITLTDGDGNSNCYQLEYCLGRGFTWSSAMTQIDGSMNISKLRRENPNVFKGDIVFLSNQFQFDFNGVLYYLKEGRYIIKNNAINCTAYLKKK